MDLLTVLSSRRSIRRYKPDPIPPNSLKRILDAIRLAPTAANRQPFLFVIVEHPMKTLTGIIKQDWVLDAPNVIIAFGNRKECWKRSWDSKLFHFVDAAIAMDHLILIAFTEGLGTCWVAANDPEQLRNALNVSDEFEFVALTPIGFPDELPPARPRKDLENFTKFV